MSTNVNPKISRNQLEEFFLNSNIQIDFGNFILAILLSSILAYFVKFSYLKVSRSLNDKEHFSDIFVPLSIITTLVITVVKFSLALSLGLVGALSIVRFRAAIKEPEELVFLFFIIGIGLANGANQFLLAIISTFLIISILYLRKMYQDKKSSISISDSSTNILQLQIFDNKFDSDKIISELKNNVNYLNLKSFTSEKDLRQYNFWFDVDNKKLSILINKIESLSTNSKDIKIQVFSRSGVYE